MLLSLDFVFLPDELGCSVVVLICKFENWLEYFYLSFHFILRRLLLNRPCGFWIHSSSSSSSLRRRVGCCWSSKTSELFSLWFTVRHLLQFLSSFAIRKHELWNVKTGHSWRTIANHPIIILKSKSSFFHSFNQSWLLLFGFLTACCSSVSFFIRFLLYKQLVHSLSQDTLLSVSSSCSFVANHDSK